MMRWWTPPEEVVKDPYGGWLVESANDPGRDDALSVMSIAQVEGE